MNVVFQNADVLDADILSRIARTSKKFWNYPDEQLDMWADELSVTADYIGKNSVIKILSDGIIIGFFAIVYSEIPELDHLWLLPEYIGKGIGKTAFTEVRKRVGQSGKSSFTLVAEPNAKGFYAKMGGKVISRFESRIPGRFLEVMAFGVD